MLKVTIVPEQELAAWLAGRDAEEAPQADESGEDELAGRQSLSWWRTRK